MAKARVVMLSFVLLMWMTVSVNGYDHLVGGRMMVKNVKMNKEVQELGKFCVEEFNRSQKLNDIFGKLRFSEVVEAQKQVVAGIKYYLTIEAATEIGELQFFDSVVVVKPWVQSKELLNFAPSN